MIRIKTELIPFSMEFEFLEYKNTAMVNANKVILDFYKLVNDKTIDRYVEAIKKFDFLGGVPYEYINGELYVRFDIVFAVCLAFNRNSTAYALANAGYDFQEKHNTKFPDYSTTSIDIDRVIEEIKKEKEETERQNAIMYLFDKFFSLSCGYKKESIRQNTYIMTDSSNLFKIGKSQDVDDRLHNLKLGNPSLKIVLIINEDVEKELHKHFYSKMISREWFSLDKNDLDYVIRNYSIIRNNIEKLKIFK